MKSTYRTSDELFADEEVDIQTFLKGFSSDIRTYLRAEKELILMNLSEKAGSMVSGLLYNVILFVALLCTVFFLNLALGFYLAEVLDNMPAGFALVGALYLVLFLFFHIWWKAGGRDAFILSRIQDILDDDETIY